ncbi:MAG TPA: AAA family ATPase [Roseiarcus sp.]|nr:AAA family ATPase [Roseiarcus sp.]
MSLDHLNLNSAAKSAAIPPELQRVMRETVVSREESPPSRGNGSPPVGQRNLFPIEMCDDIAFDVENEDLIDGVLPKVGVAMLYGKPGSLKTFVSFDWGMSIGKGDAWGGRRVERGFVVYIAAEGSGGLRKRKKGYEMARGIPRGTPFALMPAAPNLGTDKGDLAKLFATIDAYEIKPAAIFIDTASKSLGSGDENGSGMQTLINNAVAISLKFQCCVILVHHVGVAEGTEKRPRGFSGSTGGVETQILCERPDEAERRAVLTIQKQKDDEDNVAFDVILDRVVVGTNRRGKVHSTLVVTEVSAADACAPKTAKPKKTPASLRLLMDCVAEAIGESGKNHQIPNGPMVCAVAEQKIRDVYRARIAERAESDEDAGKLFERQRKSFRRAIESALKTRALAAADQNGERIIWET